MQPVTLRATFHLAEGADRLFAGWVEGLRAGGVKVSASVGVDSHLDADIVFACGLLTAIRIREGARRTIVAAPIFAGEHEPVYRSVIIARADSAISSLPGHEHLRLAVNEYGSWSGWHGLKEHLRVATASPTLIGDHVLSGGHVSSIEEVLSGRADIASIDHSVWEARRLIDQRLSELVVVESTRDWPAPPLSINNALPLPAQTQLTAAITALPGVVAVDADRYAFMLAELDDHRTWPP